MRDIYPRFFRHGTIVDTINAATSHDSNIRYLDLNLAIDRIVNVVGPASPIPMSFYFQERFRKPEWRWCGDVTITTYNRESGERSELYKLAAEYMVYGYYDGTTDRFVEAFVFWTTRLKRRVNTGKLEYTQSVNKKGQEFATIPISRLRKEGILLFQLTRDA